MRRSTSKERGAASVGASIGASIGGKAGPFGAGIGAGVGGAVGYIAGALTPGCGCRTALPDGGQTPDDRTDHTDTGTTIPVTDG